MLDATSPTTGAPDAQPPRRTLDPGRSATPRAEGAARTRTDAWVFEGILSGVIGAAVIALFFLAFDVAAGHPFWTPGALGHRIFMAEPLAPGATPAPALVLAYTVLHGGVFVAVGLMASFGLAGNRARLGRLSGLVLAALLFAGLEVFFVTFIHLMAPGLLATFGAGRVASANVLAAVTMAATLLRPGSGGEAAEAE